MIEHHTLRIRRRRIAAPARIDNAEPVVLTVRDRELAAVCEAWADWCRTRRFYGRPAAVPSVLGQLGAHQLRDTSGQAGPNAVASADLAAFHLAIISRPREERDRIMFEAHWLLRVKPIKRAAALVGVHPATWYRHVNAFGHRAWDAHFDILRAHRELVKLSQFPATK